MENIGIVAMTIALMVGGSGKFKAVRFAYEINERFKEGKQEEFRNVSSLHPLDSSICSVEQEQYYSCHEDSGEYKVEYRYVQCYELICPDIGHAP